MTELNLLFSWKITLIIIISKTSEISFGKTNEVQINKFQKDSLIVPDRIFLPTLTLALFCTVFPVLRYDRHL